MKAKVFAFILGMTSLFLTEVFAQIGIGTSTPDSTSVLDLSSSSKGVLIPRMSRTEIINIENPATGLTVFCTTDNKFYTFVLNTNGWREISFGPGVIAPSFTCGNPYTDYRDTTTYGTILIGTQCWMAENLNTGTRLFGLESQTDNDIIEKYCYDNLESNCDIYGGLYQWNEVMQYTTQAGAQGICPLGWHVPTTAEWANLSTFLGGDDLAGGALKETGTVHWLDPNTGATNTSNFTGLPGGRNSGGTFATLGLAGNMWTSNEYATDDHYCRRLVWNTDDLSLSHYTQIHALSVRCLRDD